MKSDEEACFFGERTAKAAWDAACAGVEDPAELRAVYEAAKALRIDRILRGYGDGSRDARCEGRAES
jgi:hypothetical protein